MHPSPTLVPSPAEDHEPAHAYACYLADAKRKAYGHVYLGARWELALARRLGAEVHAACLHHLARVNDYVKDDFVFDFEAGGIKIDAKSTQSRSLSRRNNLLVTHGHLRADVAYVLGDVVRLPVAGDQRPWPSREQTTAELWFEAAGWEMGDPALFSQWRIPGLDNLVMRRRDDLRPFRELEELVHTGPRQLAA